MGIVIDHVKIGRKGYPRHFAELGVAPPTKYVEDAPTGVSPATPTPSVDLKAYAAEARWRKETGGITVGGVPVATDRESQAMLMGAHAYVQVNPSVTIRWKTEGGFVTLDAEQVTALALAVGAHVQACFGAEADVVTEIASGAITTAAGVDAAFSAVATSC